MNDINLTIILFIALLFIVGSVVLLCIYMSGSGSGAMVKSGYQLTYVTGSVTQAGRKAFGKYNRKFVKLYDEPQLVIKRYQRVKLVNN